MDNYFLILKLVLVVLVGYLFGSANTSVIVGRLYGIDIREHGSKNAGLTNTLRTLGKLAALLVIVGDVAKGVLACLVGMYVVGNVDVVGAIGLMAGGTASVIGHIWPVYFGFKGGKGILTSFSVILMMNWKIGMLLFLIFAVIVAVTRYVSLGSIIGCAVFPILGIILKQGTIFLAFALLLACIIIMKHRGNIRRLLDGTEAKLSFK